MFFSCFYLKINVFNIYDFTVEKVRSRLPIRRQNSNRKRHVSAAETVHNIWYAAFVIGSELRKNWK